MVVEWEAAEDYTFPAGTRLDRPRRHGCDASSTRRWAARAPRCWRRASRFSPPTSASSSCARRGPGLLRAPRARRAAHETSRLLRRRALRRRDDAPRKRPVHAGAPADRLSASNTVLLGHGVGTRRSLLFAATVESCSRSRPGSRTACSRLSSGSTIVRFRLQKPIDGLAPRPPDLACSRPSYQRIRELVHETRA